MPEGFGGILTQECVYVHGVLNAIFFRKIFLGPETHFFVGAKNFYVLFFTTWGLGHRAESENVTLLSLTSIVPITGDNFGTIRSVLALKSYRPETVTAEYKKLTTP